MGNMGKSKFKWELEKFVTTRLKNVSDCCSYEYNNGLEERFQFMDQIWESYELKNEEYLKKIINFSQLTNHEICHEMFWNAFRGRSKMFVQIQDLRSDDNNTFINNNQEFITLQCSLLTLQMLDYDIMMFNAMSDEDKEYKNAAQQHYRPYLFSFVAEIDKEKYRELQEFQKKLERTIGDSRNQKAESSPYMWIECTFNSNIKTSHINLNGYVVQSASNIDKIEAMLSIIEDDKTTVKMINDILDKYTMPNSCIDDKDFIDMIEGKLGGDCLSKIDVFKIGNGNCVFAQSISSNQSFFYDIGFNYKHRPQKISSGVTYNYSKSMKKIVTENPSFFILSHWDMDHIAGSAIASKDWFDKDWFAPDCLDACTDAKRLAKYLYLKGHLYLAKRCPRNSKFPGRLIGRQIDIKSISNPSQILASYRFYMGKKDKCDRRYPNCEGIVIEYTDKTKNKIVLMMGDVNYASFNEARSKLDPKFAYTQIDYLIVPHHGSEHTDYDQITDNGKSIKKGKLAIICCTNEPADNRPNKDHLKELKKRFNVCTTEQVKRNKVSITIKF